MDRIALAIDMWTAKSTKWSFMAIIAHFIDYFWVLQSQTLQFVYVWASHNNDALSKVLLESLFDWNISTKIYAITVDNATTNDDMMDAMIDCIYRSPLMLRGKFIHMRCHCYIVNLIVKDGLEVAGDEIGRIRSSCIFWSSNQSRRKKFEKVICQLNLPLKALETDAKTKWNST